MIARLLCLMHGHNDRLAFARAGVKLRCADCGRMTKGWTLDRPLPRLTREGIQQRHVLFNRRLLAKKPPYGPVWWLKAIYQRKERA